MRIKADHSPSLIASDALSGEAGIQSIQRVLSGRPVRKLLRDQLQAVLEPKAEPGPLRIRRVKFKPGRKLTVHYDLPVKSRAGRELRPIVVVWTSEGDPSTGLPGNEHALEAEARTAGLARPFRRLVGRVPRAGLRTMIWPLDPWIPELVHVADPRRVRSMLANAYEVRPAEMPSYRVRTIRYRPRERHVLRYDPISSPGATETVFAKLTRDPDVLRAFRVASRVSDWLDRSDGDAGASRPLAAFPDDRVILYPVVPGKALSSMLGRGDVSTNRALHRAGRVIRLLHEAPRDLGAELEGHELDAEIRSIARASEHVAVLLPDVGARIARILERAQALYASLPGEAATFTHSDFKADHLWVSPSKLTILDFGTCAIADPASDLGKMLADLHWWFTVGELPGIAAAQEAFLSGYGPSDSPDRVRRARLFEVLVLVKSTVHRVPLFDRQWARRTEALIELGERLMRGVERAAGLKVARAGRRILPRVPAGAGAANETWE